VIRVRERVQRVWLRFGLAVLVATAMAALTMAPATAAVDATVTPANSLRDGQTVHVKASGLPPSHSLVQVVQCAKGAVDSLHCDGNTLDVNHDTDAHGDYDNPSFVVHTLSQQRHDSIDCDATHPCEIYVGVDYNNNFKIDSTAVPISFASAASAGSTAKSGSSGSGSSTGALLAVIAAAVVILVVVGLSVRRRRSKSQTPAART
jgi:hypothetical protein